MNLQSNNLHPENGVRMTVETRFNDCCTQATVKHPASVMIWKVMFNDGTAGLFFYQSK